MVGPMTATTSATRTAMVRRITRAYRASTAAHRAAGLGWYAEAWRVANEIAEGLVGAGVWTSWDERTRDALARQVAGVIAALSPRCQWSTNVVWARAVMFAAWNGLDMPAVSTKPNRRTAWRIANGEHPLTALGTLSPTGRVISGHKVRAFWANICGDVTAVTVDIWAIRAAMGAHAPADGSINAALYELTADAYRRAAAILGITPRECQAAVWVHTRGVKPTDAGFHAAAAA
jgi:hypothetical protein